MRKVISILACLIVLCILLGANLHVLGMSKVKATGNGWTLAVLSLLSFGPDSASPTGLSPAQIQSVYRLPSTGGTGTIAIIDAYDDPTVLNDANVFSNQYGLPTVSSLNVT
jgi:subtilase family serine protease